MEVMKRVVGEMGLQEMLSVMARPIVLDHQTHPEDPLTCGFRRWVTSQPWR
jgi:hypothetical protein